MSLSCQNLGCQLGGRYLFENLSFEAGPGDTVRVVGSNGSGKTTLLRVLTGLRRPHVGSVSYRGRDIFTTDSAYHSELLFLGHAVGLKDNLTARENLSYLEELYNPDSEGIIREALSSAGIPDVADRPVRFLSQGQRRRVALARLHLSRWRQLWVLDEPFVGLDLHSTDRLRRLIEAHRAAGGVVVYTTHQEVGLSDTQVLRLDPISLC